MRAFAVALMLALLDIPAHGQSLQVNGKFGFLGEYELSASVTSDTVGSEQKFYWSYDHQAHWSLHS
jgi:hypothetical protein